MCTMPVLLSTLFVNGYESEKNNFQCSLCFCYTQYLKLYNGSSLFPHAVAAVLSQLSPCGICGGCSDTGTGFCLRTAALPCQSYSTHSPYLRSLNLPQTLCDVSNRQRSQAERNITFLFK
jgi:hypothetical protein